MADIECKKCGAINFLSIQERGGHHIAYCSNCGAYVKHMAHDKQRFYFGKHKGQEVETFTDLGYLEWFLKNSEKISPAMRTALQDRISKLKAK